MLIIDKYSFVLHSIMMHKYNTLLPELHWGGGDGDEKCKKLQQVEEVDRQSNEAFVSLPLELVQCGW